MVWYHTIPYHTIVDSVCRSYQRSLHHIYDWSSVGAARRSHALVVRVDVPTALGQGLCDEIQWL